MSSNKPKWAQIGLHFVFYKQPVYKQLALGWQIAKQLSGRAHLVFIKQQ